jgi:glycoside/pentoside/hexuronide:cation symporter, GPH family
VPKLIGGVVFDASAGILSDRWRARFGRRNWLLVGALGAPALMLALFNVPVSDPADAAVYVMIVFALYMAVFASFSVPYLAIAGDLALQPEQRTVLMAWRLGFTAIGVLIAGAVAPGVVQATGGGREGYATMAWVLAAICAISLLIGWWGAGRAERDVGINPTTSEALGLRATMQALADPRFSVLSVATLLQLAGGGMAYAGLIYFMTYNLGLTDALAKVGPVVLLSCVGIAVAQPFWVRMSKRWGKQRTYVAAAIIHAIAHLGWASATWGGLPVLYAFAVVLGIGNSGWAMLGFSMVADLGGEGRAGLFSAVYIMLDKVAFALGGALIIGLILAAYGFDASAAAQGLPQPESAKTGILIAFALAPAACNIFAAALFARWGKVSEAVA